MNELSMHILDLAQNSMIVGSTLVEIYIVEDVKKNIFSIEIIDDGHGMDEEKLDKAISPFYTSRTTRKVGLGLSLFKMLCELTEGEFNLTSEIDKGTKLYGSMKFDHIDRPHLGDIVGTIIILILNENNIDIKFSITVENENYTFDTKVIKEILDGVPLTEPSVIEWIRENLKEEIYNLHKEVYENEIIGRT